MTLKTKLSGAEHAALDESLKTLYLADGDGFRLDSDAEDVEGLKLSKTQILAEKKRLEKELEDLQKFKTDHEQTQSQVEEEKLKEAGAFKELEQKLRDKIAELESTHAAETAEDHEIIKLERLKNLSVAKGMLPDRVKYAIPEIKDKFDLVKEGKEFSLKYKDGIGDAKEIDSIFEGLKTDSAFLFAANGASGGGAQGSNENAGGGQDSVMTGAQKLESAYATTTIPTK